MTPFEELLETFLLNNSDFPSGVGLTSAFKVTKQSSSGREVGRGAGAVCTMRLPWLVPTSLSVRSLGVLRVTFSA